MADLNTYEGGAGGQRRREVEPSFTQPFRQIFLMLIVLGLVGFGLSLAIPRVLAVFLTNPWLNGFIVGVFAIGVIACFLQVIQLMFSVNWIKGFAADHESHDDSNAPRLLLPLATLLSGHGSGRTQIGATSATSILDSVATRIDEARDITRYIVNLLIFLGLLGTFYGLATSVPALVETISSLAPAEGEETLGVDVFGRLMSGVQEQLSGMGTAFASSLLGLAGSLVVGMLELFAGHGQNRFYGELEEWLSTITRIGFSSGDGSGSSDEGQTALVLDHMSRQMEQVQDVFARAEVARLLLDEKLAALLDRMSEIKPAPEVNAPDASLFETQNAILNRIAGGQDQLLETLSSRAEEDGEPHVDAESRMRLRSIDVQLLRILEELSTGRQESVADLKAELSQVARALETLAAPLTGRGTGSTPRNRDG